MLGVGGGEHYGEGIIREPCDAQIPRHETQHVTRDEADTRLSLSHRMRKRSDGW